MTYLLQNLDMISNSNEKCLLKFISNTNEVLGTKSELFEIMYNFGIKIKFKSQNPVYQIIDELSYCDCIQKSEQYERRS